MGENKISNWQLVWRGIVDENTIFRLAISLCPAIAVTSTLKNGFFMGISVLFVQAMVSVTIASIKNFIHSKIRLPVFMLVISGWVTITDMSMAAFVPAAYKEMGLYIQLIVAFASILAGAEMFASKNGVVPAFFDGIGRGAGFLVSLVIIASFREFLGKGSIGDFVLLGGSKPLLIMVLPAGGFIAVGLLMAMFNWVDLKYLKKRV